MAAVRVVPTANLEARLEAAIQEYRDKYPNFRQSYDSYLESYGPDAIKIYAPTEISRSFDPVLIYIGDNVPLEYKDSNRSLRGGAGIVNLNINGVYLLGRTSWGDGELLLWSPEKETLITRYNQWCKGHPSRVHGAFFVSSDSIYYADLGSTHGSIVLGEYTDYSLLRKVYSLHGDQFTTISTKR